MKAKTFWSGMIGIIVVTHFAAGVVVEQSEMETARQWISTNLGNAQPAGPVDEKSAGTLGTVPLSFVYGGIESKTFLSSWIFERNDKSLDAARHETTLSYTDPATGLQVRCVAVEYLDFPTVEWTLYFKNTGSADTPILSNLQAIDADFTRGAEGEFILNHHTGDLCTADSYEPHAEPLKSKTEKVIANFGGRPTQGTFPYFNLEWPTQGVIFAISWAGQWETKFTRDEGTNLRIQAGQQQAHFTLHPGEEIRTPMIVLQFWQGTRLHAQNVWRQWMIAHNMPRPGGKLPPVPQLAACSSHQYGEMIHADRDSQIFFVDRYLEKGIKLDYWWMDAGWYINTKGWPETGTWEVDLKRFPGGLRAITDHCHAKGVKSLVWFEPERVAAGTWLATQHPEWIFGGEKGGLLKLGEEEPRHWLTEHVDGLLVGQGIDLYRQDFNMDPLDYWRGNDPEDRQGITEIRHVMGYFAYWDELRRRHPDMLIDSCASGGRRNDLETLRRAVPLLRSDYIMEPVGNQCHTYALSYWFPFYGTGTSKTDPYLIRSVLCPHFIACWDMRSDELDYGTLKKLIDQWNVYAPNFLGDYYPLTTYSLDNDRWIAWQFDRNDKGEGMVQVFRRAESPYETAHFPLAALNPHARYRVKNLDRNEEEEWSGSELLQNGLPVTMRNKPDSVVFTYRKKISPD